MNVRSIVIAVISALPLAASAASLQINADSRVTGVTVYNDRALVTRSATVKLQQGTNTVTFDGLPLTLTEDTLRAEGRGNALAKISGLTIRNVYLEKLQEKRLAELEERIYTLERNIQKIDARRTALASQRAFIESIKVGWGERISKDLTAGKPASNELGDATRFIGEGINRVEDQLYDAAAEKKPLLEKIAALKKQLEQSRSEQKKEVRAVDLTVEAPNAMDLQMDLSYLVDQASWEPAYDLRLAADGKSAELVYRAMIWQKSGEEWQDANLSLSTASPAAGSAPPELNPWRISLYVKPQPIPIQLGRMKRSAFPEAAPMATEMQTDDKGTRSDVAEVEALPLTAQLSEGQTSVLFIVPKPVSIPADGTRYGSIIALERVPVTAEYVAIPKLSPKVFLKSEVSNMTAYPLLSGEVNVFNDNAFTGKSHLKTVAAGEKFDLFFGIDEQVKAKRKVTKIRKDAGIMAGNQISWRCTVEIENFKKDAITLTVIDQIPVAGNDEIKVALAESQPKPDETRQDGTVLWKLSLKPGEKRKIAYEIDVEYPKGRDIVGTE